MHSPPKNRMSRNHAGRCAKNGAADTLCPLRHFVLANFCAARGAKRLLRSIFSSRVILSQDWLPTVQLVLQADWQVLLHSPHPVTFSRRVSLSS